MCTFTFPMTRQDILVMPAVDVRRLLQEMRRSAGNMLSKTILLYSRYISAVKVSLSQISFLDFVSRLNFTDSGRILTSASFAMFSLGIDTFLYPLVFLKWLLSSTGSTSLSLLDRGFGRLSFFRLIEEMFKLFDVWMYRFEVRTIVSPRVCHAYFRAKNRTVHFKLSGIDSGG